MNKQELLKQLEEMSFVNALIGDAVIIETKPNGDKWLQQNIREVVGEVAKYRNIDFYELADLTAFYKDQTPKQTIIEAVEA